MGKLVTADDGLPAEEVHDWVDEKLFDVRTYVDVTRAARRMFLPPNPGGATYIDLFCGPGRARVHETGKFVDGTAVAAWRCSVEKRSPFTAVYIADLDEERRRACAERLRRLDAPVHEVQGDALTAARELTRILPPHALHFAVVDPYSLGELRIDILRSLASLRRMDILVHLAAMDLYRNIEQHSAEDDTDWDSFAPGWREHVPLELPKAERRARLIDYWGSLVIKQLDLNASEHLHPIHNSKNRLLYWLLLLHRHELAEKFWKAVRDARPQQTRDMF
jgi:three-Cys-motif partner protein